jgi:hypothetical protein
MILTFLYATPGRLHHRIRSHGRSHDTRASELWTAAGG